MARKLTQAGKRYWLMKSEPNAYSIDDLQKEKTACWDGVRNYQARNFMRDDMKVGDLVLYYHSNSKPSGVVGIAKVCREAYPDHTAFDPKDPHYDPKSKREDPAWMMVDLEFVKKFPELVTLDTLKKTSALKEMLVIKRGQRLSVQPVDREHFDVVRKLGQKKR